MADSTADAVNHLVDKIGDGLGQITAAISSHAPQAWALVVQGSYARAISNIVYGAGLTIPAIILGVAGWLIFQAGWKRIEKEDPEAGIFICAGGITVGIASLIATCVALAWLLDPHSIATLISPDGVTARDLLINAMGGR